MALAIERCCSTMAGALIASSLLSCSESGGGGGGEDGEHGEKGEDGGGGDG